ncbi:MAG: hypothetical protein U1E60_04885 [Reyranellaceae bacterium]
MNVATIALIIVTSIASSIIAVPYLWWTAIFSGSGVFSLEAGLALIGTAAFWVGSLLAINRHDVHWLWRGAGVIAAAVVVSSVVQRVRHRNSK